MSESAVIRPALAADAVAIAAVYNQGIEDRVATFETRLRAPDEVAGWLAEGQPLLVADRDGVVAGFARISPFSEREVYATVGKHGVYVAREARGQGLGRRLLEALCDAAAATGFHKVTSGVFADNGASLAAHRAAGFREVGVQQSHGRLEGAWRDVVLVERLVGPAAQR